MGWQTLTPSLTLPITPTRRVRRHCRAGRVRGCPGGFGPGRDADRTEDGVTLASTFGWSCGQLQDHEGELTRR